MVKRFSRSLRQQELWDTWDRPNYLTGVLRGADQAKEENINKICALEFGVASGRGLLALQAVAEAVEAETGVAVEVYGFDTGQGLTPPAEYRDHPDRWQAGDFAMMDQTALRQKLKPRTQLVLGDVADTVDKFVDTIQTCPVGFVAIDLDYYSSTVHALKVVGKKNRKMLAHVPVYFDDMIFYGASPYAGELLAIREFNERGYPVTIDPWNSLGFLRPFNDRQWVRAMHIANDWERIGRMSTVGQQKLVLPMS